MLLKEEIIPTKNEEITALQAEISRLQEENDLLKRYVEPEVLESLANGQSKYLEIGGAYTDVSVMFVDIRNFTPMAEKFSADVVVNILHRCLDNISATIVENEGVLDKFIGDAVMAFWAKPYAGEDYIFQSVKTALKIIENMQTVVEDIQKEFQHQVSIGIGVQCGHAIVGNIGTNERLDFTVIGDIVNTAARLESQAKNGTSILIGHDVYKEIHNRIDCTEIESGLQLKGKSGFVRAYCVNHMK